MTRLRSAAAFAMVAFLQTACLSPNDPLPVRWFAPPDPPVEAGADGAPAPARLGLVTAAAHLDTAMVWRLSDVEVAIDELNRWVDTPAALVERAFERAMFDSGRFAPGDATAPELRVHVDAFEAVRAASPFARVALSWSWTDPAGHVRRASTAVDEPLASTTPDDVARALGRALTVATTRALR